MIRDILTSPRRERYDHFLAHGFPAWKGTGYYYSRVRPGLGSVVLGLWVVLGGAAHYAVLVLGWKKRREFVLKYIRDSRRMAWGSETPRAAAVGAALRQATVESDHESDTGAGVASAETTRVMNRRQKRMQDKENKKGGKKGVSANTSDTTSPSPQEQEQKEQEKQQQQQLSPTGERKRIVAPNKKILIVDSLGNVFLEEETEDGEVGEFLLDPDEIARPTIRDTALFTLPTWMFNRTVGRVLGFLGLGLGSGTSSSGGDNHFEVSEDGDEADATNNGSLEEGEEKTALSGSDPVTTSRRKTRTQTKAMRQRRAAGK